MSEEIVELNGAHKSIDMVNDVDEVDGCQTSKTILSSSSLFVATNSDGFLDNGTTSDMLPMDSSCSESPLLLNGIELNEENVGLLLQGENNKLKETLADLRLQYSQLQSHSAQKESLLELQKKELHLLEEEKVSIKRNFEVAKKEKEHAVVRYAMLEKSIIDANAVKDLSVRRLKDTQKELELAQIRIKTIAGERDKAQKEVRESIRECEILRYDVQTLETKYKWNQVKFKQEMAVKAELEKKVTDLSHQLSQLNEQRQTQICSERKNEQEQGAQLIMLKHLVDEKERNYSILQTTHNETKSALTELTEKYELLSKELQSQKDENEKLASKVAENDKLIEQQKDLLTTTQTKLEQCKISCQKHIGEVDELTTLLRDYRDTEENFKEQCDEMRKVRAKEEELLKLLKDLTEKCVVVENKLILAESKSSGLQIENERLKNEFRTKHKVVTDLEQEIVKKNLNHNEEVKLFNRLLAEEKGHSETLQNQLDNVQGDLDAIKNKHAQHIKELTRELSLLRSKHSENSSPKSERSYNSDSGLNSNLPSSNADIDANKEPSKKVLIDRIVKLQRQLAKQTEKIEFLENHCVALFNELKSKSQ